MRNETNQNRPEYTEPTTETRTEARERERPSYDSDEESQICRGVD